MIRSSRCPEDLGCDGGRGRRSILFLLPGGLLLAFNPVQCHDERWILDEAEFDENKDLNDKSNSSFSNLFLLLLRGLLDDIVFGLGATERSRDPARLSLLLRQRHVRICFGSGRGLNRLSILALIGAEIRDVSEDRYDMAFELR